VRLKLIVLIVLINWIYYFFFFLYNIIQRYLIFTGMNTRALITCIICRREMKNDCEAFKEDLFITSINVKITHHNVEDILNS
jgi:hypothetical protein